MDSLPSFDFIVFDKISKRKISSYLLGIAYQFDIIKSKTEC